MNKYPLGRRDNLVVQEIDGEIMIYDLTDNKVFCLNETSALIWQLCDGNKSALEISKLVSKKLNSSANEELVWLALEQLSKENLIRPKFEMENILTGLSRREVIKRIGLGSMVALPIVASMVAPMAVHANSACIVGGLCECNTLMGPVAPEVCATDPLDDGTGMGVIIGMACADMNCTCQRLNMGNAAGNCQR